MSSHVYGPVPSRRLGRSLGVSLVPPKTCTYSCVYCQLGRTTDQTLQRQSFFPPEEVLEEIRDALGAGEAEGAVDHVTFAGDGEPTLCSDLGYLIEAVKEGSDVPVAVITNGSLLHDPGVRSDLMEADRVLPTLATVRPQVWRRMHRPHRGLDLPTMIRGLVEFSQEYEGDIWLEVMLVRGLNDDEGSLRELREVIDTIGPDRLDLLVPTRPPTEPWVEVPDPPSVLRAMEVLGAASALVREADGSFSVSQYASGREALLTIGTRHPLREKDARDICASLEDAGAVSMMLDAGELLRVDYRGEVFLLPRHLIKMKRDDDDIQEEA